MPTMPTYSVGVAWTEQLTGVFRVGISQVDSTSDVLGSGFGGSVYDDITSYVQQVQVIRGRTDDLGEMQQGTCQILLKDASGRFNPESTVSDLAGYVKPMRPMRITAAYDGSTYGLFYGYVERIEYDPLKRVTTIDGVDFFEWLANSQTVFTPSTGSTNVGASVGEFLDQLEFTDPALRSIDTGRSIAAAYALANQSYLDQIAGLLTYDRGVFFITKSGAARFISGANWWLHGTPSSTIDGDLASDMRVVTDKERIVNRQIVVYSEAGNSTYDDTSRRAYGWRDGTEIDTVYVGSSSEAIDLARWVIATRKDPIAPSRAIEVKSASTGAIRQQMTLEIGDWIRYSEPRGNTNAEGVIEGIEHTIDHAGGLHVSRYLVSKRTVNAFTVGVSVVGGPDLLYW